MLEVPRPVQRLMNKAHGSDAVPAVPKHVEGDRIANSVELETEQAVDQLKVVLDAMMDLGEEDVLFLEGGLDALFLLLAVGDVARDGDEAGDLSPLIAHRRPCRRQPEGLLPFAVKLDQRVGNGNSAGKDVVILRLQGACLDDRQERTDSLADRVRRIIEPEGRRVGAVAAQEAKSPNLEVDRVRHVIEEV